MRQVTSGHLRTAHGMTTDEYRSLGYETQTEDTRARQAKGLTHRIQPGENLGENHPRFKGGHVHKRLGYRYIWVGGKLRTEHRVVMERHLGRTLGRREIVHHRDGDRLNNSIDNLEVMTQSEHMALHWEQGGMSLPPH